MTKNHQKFSIHTIKVEDTKFYDEDGMVVPKTYQLCKCGHSAEKHVKSGLHPMNGYVCTIRSCTCKSFKFDQIKK
jgi:CDGSH-type Zn-finger protein